MWLRFGKRRESTVKRKLKIFETYYETYQKILIGGDNLGQNSQIYSVQGQIYHNQGITEDKISINWHYTAFLLF